jgi:GT2 family glycosyltransferase
MAAYRRERPYTQRIIMTSSEDLVDAAVCIVTYNRPRELARLLDRLEQVVASASHSVAIVVADNDRAGSAKPVAMEFARRTRVPVVYTLERRPGVSQARNAAVRAAPPCRNIAFLDDDEIPSLTWLSQLLETQARWAVEIVAGPVVSVFNTRPPQWVLEGKVFDLERGRRETGARMKWCATGNCLVARPVFDIVGDFDDRYGRSGGEDTHFFYRATLAGFRIAWCAESVVEEVVVADRVTPRWVILRALRTGNTRARIERELVPNPCTLAKRLMKACALITVGVLRTAQGVLTGRRGVTVNGLQRIASALGALVALAGRDL